MFIWGNDGGAAAADDDHMRVDDEATAVLMLPIDHMMAAPLTSPMIIHTPFVVEYQ